MAESLSMEDDSTPASRKGPASETAAEPEPEAAVKESGL
jgi:hypothetical protein